MTLDGIYGLKGSGKNIISVLICKYFVPKDVPIYTNFELRLPNAHLIEPEDLFDVFTIKNENDFSERRELITDEAYGWLESRGSGFNELNKYLSWMISQSRKRGLNWKCIAQLRAMLDLRWRGQEDRIIYCHKRNLDSLGNSEEDFNYSFIEGGNINNYTIDYDNAKQFFPMYNTNQVILPQEFKEISDRIKFKKHPELLNKYINGIADLVIKEHDIPCRTLVSGEERYSITDDWLRDKLLEMKKMEAMDYTKYIKCRIKGKLGIN